MTLKSMTLKSLSISTALVGVMSAPWVHAGPADYVATPTVEYGEKEIDFKTGAQQNKDKSSNAATSIGIGFTPAEWWFTEVYAKYARPAGEDTRYDAWEWENRFQLTESGRYPVDVGLLLEIEHPEDRAEGYEVKWGPMLQTDMGLWQANLNAFIERHVRNTEPADVDLEYQAQLKYRHSEQLEWGVQAFGGAGQWDDWVAASQHELRVGPALFGKIKSGTGTNVKWNAAILNGTTRETPDLTARLQAEIEFR